MICPECDRFLQEGSKACPSCGWSKVKRKAPRVSDVSAPETKPCCFPGCTLRATSNWDGAPQCRYHLMHRHDIEKSHAIVREIREKGLPPVAPDWAMLSAQAFKKKHDLVRRSDESARQFAERCLAAAGASLGTGGEVIPPDLSINRATPRRSTFP